jgi:hypothetical protein
MQSVQEQHINTPDIESSGVSQVTDSLEIEVPEIEMPEIEVPEIEVVVVPNIEEVSIPVSSVPIPICQSSTDRKPICVFGFAGGYNNCLGFLHHSVKPIVGVVKYDFSTWALFPTTITQSRELALKWSNSFEKRKDFVNKSVIIFFHQQMKTIRIEVKEKMPAYNIGQQDGLPTQPSQPIQPNQPIQPRQFAKRVHGAQSYSKYYSSKYQPLYTTGLQVPCPGNMFGGYLTPEQMNYFPYQGYTQAYTLPYAYAQPPLPQ